MYTLSRHLLLVIALQCLAGCAAMISRTGTDESELIHAGVTKAQLSERLGPPLRSADVSPPMRAAELGESDHQVIYLNRFDPAVSAAVFKFTGRLGKDSRAVQASFDSFMTLGLAEIYLIPKALWERVTDEHLQLTVWFDTEGRAVAYKWAEAPTH